MLSGEEQYVNLAIIKQWVFDWEVAAESRNVDTLMQLLTRHGEILRLRDTLTIQGLFSESFRIGIVDRLGILHKAADEIVKRDR